MEEEIGFNYTSWGVDQQLHPHFSTMKNVLEGENGKWKKL